MRQMKATHNILQKNYSKYYLKINNFYFSTNLGDVFLKNHQ